MKIQAGLLALLLSCMKPALADGLFIQPQGNDRYVITATGTASSHVLGAKYSLRQVSDTGDTVIFESFMEQHGSGVATATCTPWRASQEVYLPKRVKQVELRNGEQGSVCEVPGHKPPPSTSSELTTAISHSEQIEFQYDGKTIKARPMYIYRAADGSGGEIVLCTVQEANHLTVRRSFYVARMKLAHAPAEYVGRPRFQDARALLR